MEYEISKPVICENPTVNVGTKVITSFIFGIGVISLFFFQEFVQKEYVMQKSLSTPLALLKTRSKHHIVARDGSALGWKSVRILCWIMTGPQNHEARASHVKKTWGNRCNKLVFMSSQNDTKLGAVGLPNVTEGHGNLWLKTQASFRHVWTHHKDDADWFLKADDDTYVILENLRHFLWTKNYLNPIYFGCRFKSLEKGYSNGYMSGGAGYVLSKEAVRRFAEILPGDHKCFKRPEKSEDDMMGQCMEDAGVVAGDSRDEMGRYRFLPFDPSMMEDRKNNLFWYWKYIFYPQNEGNECCSNTAISFHYLGPDYMYLMDYLVYRLKPFGFPSKSVIYNPYS